MNKQTVTKYTGIISLSSILGLELLLANALTFSDCGEIWGNQMKCILFFVCITGLIASTVVNIIYSAIHPGKLKGVIKTLIKNSVSGNVLDILFVIFFLLHLTWIPDAVFEWIKEDFCWVHPFIFLSGMIIATLLKPHIEKESTDNPLVLLTGISDIDLSRMPTLLRPVDEKKSINKIIIFIDQYIKLGDPDAFRQKYAIDDEVFEKIAGLKKSFDQLSAQKKPGDKDVMLKDADKDWLKIIESFLKEIIRGVEISIIECNYDKIQRAYEIISQETDQLLDGVYTDEHLMFNLTPGNKNISIALALNSIRGNRRSCYIQQSGITRGKLEYEELDVFRLKDIFTELND